MDTARKNGPFEIVNVEEKTSLAALIEHAKTISDKQIKWALIKAVAYNIKYSQMIISEGILADLRAIVADIISNNDELMRDFLNGLFKTLPSTSTTRELQIPSHDHHQQISNLQFQQEISRPSIIVPNPQFKVQTGGGKYFNIIEQNYSFNNKFKYSTYYYIIKFKNIPSMVADLFDYLDKAFDELVKYITKDQPSHYKIGVKLSLVDFENTKPIGIPFTNISEFKSESIGNLLEHVSQSNSKFLLTDLWEISVTILHVPSGGSDTIKAKFLSDNDILKHKKKSVINISLNSVKNYCLPVSILLGKCIADNNKSKITQYKRSKDVLLQDVQHLVKTCKANVDEIYGSCINQINLYQKYLTDYNIVVFHDKANPENKLYDLLDKTKKQIFIFYMKDSSHFVAIKNLKGFFGRSQCCEYCFTLFNNTKIHLCAMKCSSCESSPPCTKVDSKKIKCDLCNRYFYGLSCFEAHKSATCKFVKFCERCSCLTDTRRPNRNEHNCDEVRCTICYEMVSRDHQCYIKKLKSKTPTRFSLIFYDLETTQNVRLENDTYIHEPILCVAEIMCHKCFMIPDRKYKCPLCMQRLHIFENGENVNCVQKFVTFCETFRPHASKTYCIAHNFKGYDGHFLLKELVTRNKPIIPIMGGMKIFKITYNDNIVFIDSLNFLPIALIKFPKTFGLDENLSKGWYPHFFNTKENYNYVGVMPEKDCFGISKMSLSEREQFNIWYQQKIENNYIFNNRNELMRYCIKDVMLLRHGCIKFMTDFLAVTNVNPFLESFTLAQAVMKVYRKNYLQENTLGVVPKNLYRPGKNQSRTGLKWLIFENKKCNRNISLEVSIPSIHCFVDGFDKTNNMVYEFYGCYFHGCPKCFLNREQVSHKGGDSFQTLYLNTCLRADKIKNLRYQITEMWECDFKKFLKENPEIDEELENDPLISRVWLNPREAIYGGRTEIFKCYHKVSNGEKIRYLDFTSLYPYINKYGKNPIGHPELYSGEQCKNLDIHNIDGLIKCSILPPQNLYIPVLPYRINKKLVFTLCRCCAEKENCTINCDHDVDQRLLSGTWVMDEVKLALAKGYVIIEIFEVWKYQISQYNAVDKAGGIFTDFMNTFLKLKQEASGWPASCISEQEKRDYVEAFLQHEGISLDALAIMDNASLRNLAKLCANSLWGKFIQRNDRNQTTVVNSDLDFYNLICSPGVQLIDMLSVGDDVLWISWKYLNDEYIEPLKHVSLPIGAYTTTSARIKLYSVLEKVGKSILYCDTDSIIFIEKPDEQNILPTGNYIGDLTDELAMYGDGAFITEFVSIGPKSYAYCVLCPTTNLIFEVAKCKGITLSIANKQILNFSTLKNLVTESSDEGYRTVYDDKKIKRRKIFQIVSEPESKKFGFTFTKRICKENFTTLPFGFSLT